MSFGVVPKQYNLRLQHEKKSLNCTVESWWVGLVGLISFEMIHLGSICLINNSLRVGRVANSCQVYLPAIFRLPSSHTHYLYSTLPFGLSLCPKHYAKIFIHYLLLLYNSLCWWFSIFRVHRDLWKVLFKHRLLSPTPRISDSVGLGQGSKICISNKFSGDANAIGLGNHTLRNTVLSKVPHYYSYLRPQRISKVQWLMSYRNISTSLTLLTVHIWRHILSISLLGL